MKRWFGLLALAFLLAGSQSCKKIDGEGGVVYEDRVVNGFTGISQSMDATVYYQYDTGYLVTLSGQQNILDVIQTNLEGSTLVIRYKNNVTIGSHTPVMITVSAPGVTSLNISGSGDIQMLNPWEVYSGAATISGSGNITLYGIMAHDFAATISGSGNIQINGGTARTENCTISGSGTINLQQVLADTVYANVSGSGNILVNVADLLEATISGSGNIKYLGSPVVNTHISGSGSVEHLK